MPYSALRHKLDRLASDIWRDVTLVRSTGKPFKLGEVTVTERLHMDLLHSGMVSALVTPPPLPSYRKVFLHDPFEPQTGADWDWFVQDPGSPSHAPKFLHYRIQAKILASAPATSGSTLNFKEITHKNQNGQQIYILLHSASEDMAIPYYVFYIGDPWPNKFPIALPPWWATGGSVPREHFGGTAMPAAAVEDIFHHAKVKKEATQYLAGHPGHPPWQGRRLSDLFRFSPPTAGTGAGHPSAPSRDFEVLPKELTAEQTAVLHEARARRERGEAPVIMREPRDGGHSTRMTAFFTV